MTNSVFWKLVASLRLAALLLLARNPSVFLVTAQSFRCDRGADSCPTRFDGTCDRATNPAECGDGDCFDCDECGQFDADCNACISNGCWWCPGDAACYNAQWTLANKIESCVTSSDWEENTCSKPGNFFSDPMYDGQNWVYEMINVQPVWEKGIFGKGVRVRVNDNGVEANHPEFAGRFDEAASCEIFEPVPPEEDLSGVQGFHGTTVAAILGAAANNGECSVGVAPEVTISSCYAFFGLDFFAEKLDQFDISQNSFGTPACRVSVRSRELQETCPFTLDSVSTFPCNFCDFNNIDENCENAIIQHCQQYYEDDIAACSGFLDIILGGNCRYNTIPSNILVDFVTGVTQGRDGKGVIYLFSSGNSLRQGDDTNFGLFTNSRFIISVGAVGKDSSHSSYSTPGSSLFVSAPGGDFEFVSNHITAGLNGKCQDSGVGTSFSCPVASGVVALMLEARPDLTWRDVQDILARTSQPVDDPDDTTETVNAAGIWHSNFYGFGIVDANSAVITAEMHTLVNPEQLVVAESGIVNLSISDQGGAPTVSTVTVDPPSNSFILESVEIELDLEYSVRGHLEITLTSPQGTSSILNPGSRPENTQLGVDERWKLLTVRNWGENPRGDWILRLSDTKEGDLDGCVNQPWEFTSGSTTVNCAFLERNRYCIDGEIFQPTGVPDRTFNFIINNIQNGLVPALACCECGGGTQGVPADITNQLRQWRLVMYGRNDETPAPTVAPIPSTDTSSEAPSNSSDSSATQAPTPNPTEVVTESPSTRPSTGPSLSPSITPSLSSVPSITPSGAPSELPSQGPSQGPSGAPSLNPTPTGFASFDILGTNILLEGLNSELTPTALAAFEVAIQEFLNSIYSLPASTQAFRRDLSLDRRLQGTSSIGEFATTVSVVRQTVGVNGITIVYDQAVSFIYTGNEVVDKDFAMGLVFDPLQSQAGQDELLTALKATSDEYESTSGVLFPELESGINEDDRPDFWTLGAIVSIAVGCGLCLLCCCKSALDNRKGGGQGKEEINPSPEAFSDEIGLSNTLLRKYGYNIESPQYVDKMQESNSKEDEHFDEEGDKNRADFYDEEIDR